MFLTIISHIRICRILGALWFSKRQEEIETWMSPGFVMGRMKGTLVSQQGSTCRGGEWGQMCLEGQDHSLPWRLTSGVSPWNISTIGAGAETGLGSQRWVQGQPGGYCRDPGEDNKGLNGSCVERKKEGKQQRSPPKADARGHGGERARVKRSLLWAHGAWGPGQEAAQPLPQDPDLPWCGSPQLEWNCRQVTAWFNLLIYSRRVSFQFQLFLPSTCTYKFTPLLLFLVF